MELVGSKMIGVVGTKIVGLMKTDTSIVTVTMLSSTNAMPIYT